MVTKIQKNEEQNDSQIGGIGYQELTLDIVQLSPMNGGVLNEC